MSLPLALALCSAPVAEWAGEALPTEFEIFRPGVNVSTKGEAIFDEVAARSVMAAYARHGVDRMIDLEHLSIDRSATHYDPDARGWFQLELRADGSLWAVNVRWTADGAARLREKRQRYISPVFSYDPNNGRVVRLLNVAITALPATYQTPALVAASETLESRSMDPETVAKALDMLEAGDLEGLKEMFKASIAAAAGAAGGAAPPPPMDPPADPPAPEENADPPAGDSEEDEEDKEAMAAASELMTLTEETSAGAALERVKLWRQAYVDSERARDEVTAKQAALDSAERRRLVGELVKLGAETPATAWSDTAGSVPVARLSAEPLPDLRSRVKSLAAARPAGRAPRAPATRSPSDQLTPEQLRICAEYKCDPAEFLNLRNRDREAAAAARS